MQEENNKPQPIIVVVYNITRNVTKKHILEIFSAYGKVLGVYIPKERNNVVNKSYAFIEYENREMAEKASLYMDGGQIDGVFIKIEILEPKNYIKESQRRMSRSREREYRKH